jgi:hypothetical protein
MEKKKALIRRISFGLGFAIGLPVVFGLIALACIRAFLRPMIVAFRESETRRGKFLHTADHEVANRPEKDGSAARTNVLSRGAYRN